MAVTDMDVIYSTKLLSQKSLSVFPNIKYKIFEPISENSYGSISFATECQFKLFILWNTPLTLPSASVNICFT